jgi:hypothetical protein
MLLFLLDNHYVDKESIHNVILASILYDFIGDLYLTTKHVCMIVMEALLHRIQSFRTLQ